MDTYITLSVLLIVGIVCAVKLVGAYYKQEKKNFHYYDLPLDNGKKWWYN